MVDAEDLKSSALWRAGSSPASGTKIYLASDFEFWYNYVIERMWWNGIHVSLRS